MKKMLKYLILIIFLFATNIGLAQYQVLGKVVDKNEKGISFVEVQLIKDGLAIKSEVSDQEGNFSLEVQAANYNFLIKQLGEILYDKVISVDKNLDLGTITIIENQQQLQEVVITSKKKLIERKVDRLVFNVENSISGTGGDALDALKVTPGLQVQNDQIKMIGKSGMTVMVDDRILQLSGDDLINYLKTIPSDNIKSIEVITTPPAKYEAQGNGGIINIKLKAPKKDSWNASIRSSYTQATYATGKLGGGFSYQKNKWTMLLDLNQSNGKTIYTNDSSYLYPSTEFWKNRIENIRNPKASSFLYSLGYAVSSNLKLGFQYNGSVSRTPENGNTSSAIDDTTPIQKNILTLSKTNKNVSNHAFNFNILQKLDSVGKQYSVDLDYLTFNNKEKGGFDSYNEVSDHLNTNNKNDNLQDIQNYSAKIDFTLPYSFANLETGAKWSKSISKNEVASQFIDTDTGAVIPYISRTDRFEYAENNQALYVSANKEWNKKWKTKLGLRAEYTQTNAFSKTENQTNKTNYLKFYPTAYLQYAANDNNNLSVDYSRRIQRPAYWELNPAKKYLTADSYVVENPFLEPAFSNNIELNHSYKSLLNTTFSVSKTTNVSGQITTFDLEKNARIISRQNYSDDLFFGLSETISFKPQEAWESSVYIIGYYSETRTFSPNVAPFYKGWGGSSYWNNSFVLNKAKTITAQLYYQCNFPTAYSMYKIGFYHQLNLGISGNFLDKRLNITMKGNDVFKTSSSTIKYVSDGTKMQFKQYYDSQYFQLAASYRWGSSKINLSQRKSGNEDEKSRL